MTGRAQRGAVDDTALVGLRPRATRGSGRLSKSSPAERQLKDLISIGPAVLRDFELLGIRSVAELAKQDPQKLYEKLGRVAREHQDICVLDTFCAAVAQARNPRLAAEKCEWWWWSKKRKQ